MCVLTIWTIINSTTLTFVSRFRLKDEHKNEQNASMNPSGVPTLEISSDGKASTLLTQSLAILEYIEEAHEDALALLPPKTDLLGRGRSDERCGLERAACLQDSSCALAREHRELRYSTCHQHENSSKSHSLRSNKHWWVAFWRLC